MMDDGNVVQFPTLEQMREEFDKMVAKARADGLIDESGDPAIPPSPFDEATSLLERISGATDWHPPSPSVVTFEQVLDRLQDLHDRKNRDYGRSHDPYANIRSSEDWGISPWVGSLVRAGDKFKRLQKAANGGELANESVYDSLIDLAVYSIIAVALWLEENEDTAYGT